MDTSQLKSLDDLKPAPYNPRKMGPRAANGLARSLGSFGDLSGIVWNGRTGHLVCGHQRVEQLRKIGGQMIDGAIQIASGERFPVRVVDWSVGKEKAANVVANNPAIGGEFTDELQQLLGEIQCSLGGDAFIELALDGLVAPVLTVADVADRGDADVAGEPKTNPGDIWLLGEHRLICGDATSDDVVSRVVCGDSPDTIVFDPPYEKVELYGAIPRAGPNEKILVFWDAFRFAIASGHAVAAGWSPLYEFIWDCVTSWYVPNRPLVRHKACGVFGDDPRWNFDDAVIRDGKDRSSRVVWNTRGESNYVPLNGAVHLRTVEAFPTTSESGGHDHSKPVQWIAAMLAGAGARCVLDMFAGSGTSIIASEAIGARCLGVEIDPRSCDVIVERWESTTGGNARKA